MMSFDELCSLPRLIPFIKQILLSYETNAHAKLMTEKTSPITDKTKREIYVCISAGIKILNAA